MSHILRSHLFRTFVLVVAVVSLSAAVWAQSTMTGAVAGTVTDQSKAVVVGAKVTVRNLGTNAQESATTDSMGKFRVVQLQPGTYEVTTQAPNFAPAKASAVIVEVGRITELEVALAVAGKKEAVEVTAEAPMVNTLQQDFASNLNSDSISNLPINGRRWSQYALLTPGATPDGNFGLISFRGISGLLNNNTVDGGDNNQAFFSEERGRTRAAYVISQSSIREFQVNTSNYSAEYGRAAGAVVNSVTKSGTNKIHGDGFWYIRDNALGAINPFWIKTVQNPDGTYSSTHFKPEDRRQQFGGDLGGPIIKDKLFFFFDYDGQRRNFPGVGVPGNPAQFWQPITVSNPTTRNAAATCNAVLGISGAKVPSGFTATDGEMLFCRGVTQTQANATMAALLGQSGETPRRGDQDIFFPKLDWRFNNKNTFSASYNRMRWNSPAGIQTQPTVTYAIDSFGNDYVKDDIVIGRLSSIITNNLTNELRFTWGRDFEFETSQPPVGLEQQFATAYGGRPPYITISAGGGFNLGRANFLERAAYPDESRAQWSDTVSWVTGKHFLKFGYDLSRNDDKIDNLYTGGGYYKFTYLADFIADTVKPLSCNYYQTKPTTANIPVDCFSSFSQAFGPSKFAFTNSDYAVFFQDDIHLLPRLTISLGLRYEYEKLPDPQLPNNVTDIKGNPLLPTYMNFTQKYNADMNNFGPRIGFALDVFGDGKTSLRGGYGMYYGRVINAAIFNAIATSGVPNAQVSYTYYSNSAGAPLFPNVICVDPTTCKPSAGSATPNILQFAGSLQNPQIHQADLVLEREITRNTVLSVSYLLSLGRELPQYQDVNLQPATVFDTMTMKGGPFDGKSFLMPLYTKRQVSAYSAIVDIFSNVNSRYDALVVQFNRRMTKGLQFQNSYTWSHALDFGQGSVTSGTSTQVFDPYCLKCEYGSSNFDIRHRFVSSVVWQPQMFAGKSGVVKAVLNGWSMSPIITLMSGVPYTEYVSSYVKIPTSAPFSAASGLSGINNGGGNRLPFLPRNSWRQPNIYNVDLRLSRRFKVAEGHTVEMLAEAFNLFNREQITQVNNTIYSISSTSYSAGSGLQSTLAADTTFGTNKQAGATLYRERNVQFGIKYSF